MQGCQGIDAGLVCKLGESKFCELHAFFYFGEYVGTLRGVVLIFDAGREFVLVFFHELENLLERCFSLTPRRVGAAIARTDRAFAIFQVETGDAVVVLLDDWYRRLSVDAVVVADVQVEGCVSGGRQYFLETRCAALAMGVEGNVQFAFGSEVGDSLEEFVVGGLFHRDVVCAESLGYIPDVGVFGIGHFEGGRELESVDFYAGIGIHFTEGFVLVHRDGEAPVGDCLSGFAAGFDLLGSWRGAGTTRRATGTARRKTALGRGWRVGVGFRHVTHQFNGADSAFEAILQSVFGSSGERAKAVSDCADLDSVEFRVWFGEQGGRRQCSSGKSSEVTSRNCHRAHCIATSRDGQDRWGNGWVLGVSFCRHRGGVWVEAEVIRGRRCHRR